VIGEQDDAQAAQLVRALCDLLREMTHRLASLEGRNATGNRAPETLLEVASLRRDIGEAQRHIDRLQSRYRHGDPQEALADVAADLSSKVEVVGHLGARRTAVSRNQLPT
jgi:hypothetical protein